MKRLNAVLFGAGGVGRRLFDLIVDGDEYNVIAFVDNDSSKHGSDYRGVPIYPPSYLNKLPFERLIYATQMGFREIGAQIEALGVSLEKVEKGYIETISNARFLSLQRAAEQIHQGGVAGSVAEAGVYRGAFAKHINAAFPERKLYLFDTFSGFDLKDFSYESDASLIKADHFRDTSIEDVRRKMKFPENCSFHQGFFPDSAKDIEETFAFVSLDLDLYKPTYEGLLYFWPRLSSGGFIFIHDYFLPSYPNVKKAVEAFEKLVGSKIAKSPIGDDLSIALIKL